jgi:hypothetical protein
MEVKRETIIKLLEKAGYKPRGNFYDGVDYIKDGFRIVVKYSNFHIKQLSCHLLNGGSKLMTTDLYESYSYNNVPLTTFLSIVLGPTEKILIRIQNKITERAIDGLG